MLITTEAKRGIHGLLGTRGMYYCYDDMYNREKVPQAYMGVQEEVKAIWHHEIQ